MKKFRIFWNNHRFAILLALAILLLIVATIVGLSFLESFFIVQTLATFPMRVLEMILWSIVSAFFFAMIVFKWGGPVAALRKGGIRPQDVKIAFQDVIGLTEAKREAMEVVQLIKERARLKKIGGKMVRGILMVGPPGCGKTYLAKAIAHEAKVPFFSMAGSDFVEVFVGVGASRVRKLFKVARDAAFTHGAAIIFIDELDVIGRNRVFNAFGGSEETNSTQNQLLVEMDGLGQMDANVIVIGATNAEENILDKALLRPGRFDRKIVISKPTLKDREELFAYYLKKVKADPLLDIGRLARKTVRKSPADIENIVKEAALIALRGEKEGVGFKDISEAIERVDLGMRQYLVLTPQERERVAYHETGHLMILYRLHPTNDVFKASLHSRGGALGVVYHHPREELFTATREEFLANIKVSLAGYVAEKIQYEVTSSGVAEDFRAAMQYAYTMVWNLGMGNNGFVGDFTAVPEAMLSNSLKDKLSDEVQNILHSCTQEVEAFLKQEWPMVKLFATTLLEKGELDYDEIDEIFKAHGKDRVLGVVRRDPSDPAGLPLG